MTLWLYLHFPHLQLDSLCSDTEHPACIVDHGSVIQASQSAIQKGVCPGTGLGSAASLCAQLQVHAYHPDKETEKLHEIAQFLYMITSDIALFPPSGLLLKVTGMLALYHNLPTYWDRIKDQLDRLEVRYHFATAYTPQAARLMARNASDQLCIDEQEIQSQLLQYPITATDIAPDTMEKLHRIGIRHLEGLLALNTHEIARRFDIDLVNYTGQLTGRFRQPVEFYSPPEQFTRFLELLFEMDTLQRLEKPLYKLLLQLEPFFYARDKVVYELILTLHQRSVEPQQITLTSARGEYRADKWLQLSKLTLESVTLQAPLIAITLTASQTGPRQADTSDVFDGETRSLSPPELVSLLQAKLGKEAVSSIMLTDDPRPEKTSQLCPPLSGGCNKTIQHSRPLRPSLLLPEPERLKQSITILRGPERLVSGWWDNEEVIRDYYVGRTRTGRWLWVFRDHNQKWFIHGLFS
ncbi:nucleotidyltransferase [Vibrio albus]|uniref:Nucleotidyltransferase n=1 Tax=Vibrio albus TaxID=2200953 RepID=A0A2U3BDY3_9VIBR|nr:DNA polymerase Y family protein [Vibrio albus]PWI34985.1 nucleotidyltransferase [Vibrio albus]